MSLLRRPRSKLLQPNPNYRQELDSMETFGSWSVLTTNFLIVLYLALGGVTLSALLHMANAKWRFQVRKLAVSLAVLFPVAFVLMLILLINGESTFQWLAHAQEGEGHLPG